MATNSTLPSWDYTGVLPPVMPGEAGSSPHRSPYRAELTDIIDRFAISYERVKILKGLLEFRKRLHRAGITSGFQWLDGSYTENVEVLEGRPPRDVDVVTFFYLPAGQTQQSVASSDPDLFSPASAKKQFSVDSYFFCLGKPIDAGLVQRISYWYSMWSHRRNGQWKGFVQVDLSPANEVSATELLAAREEEYV